MSFSIYVGSILISFHNGSFVCIILCILCRPLRCFVRVCEILSVFNHIVTAKRKCSISDCIKGEYPSIKGVNENVEFTLCNAKFCITRGFRFLLPNIPVHLREKWKCLGFFIV
jgi:hypothetical protein